MTNIILNGTVTTETALNSAIAAANSETTAGTYEIDLAGNITETGPLTGISLHSGVTLVINGGGIYQGLVVDAGTVSVENRFLAVCCG